MAVIIDGKKLANDIKSTIRYSLTDSPARPCLAVIWIGDDTASARYVRNKQHDCEEVGINFELHHLDANVPTAAVVTLIKRLNIRKDVSGIILQLPVPKRLDSTFLLNFIDYAKDVDNLTYVRAGKLRASSDIQDAPCTPAAVMRLLDSTGIDLDGKSCVVIGRSSLVGMPLAHLLTQANATVTVCHTHTKDLVKYCREADVLIAAAGVPGLVTADMVKEGAIVIDVGINITPEGKFCGDVCYDEVFAKAGYITPVPGGVGPMTRAMLLEAVFNANIDN